MFRTGRRFALGIVGAAIATMLGAAMLPASTPAIGSGHLAAQAAFDPSDVSVLTYNVQGLPWPAAIGRDDELAVIGARLAAYRRAGRQPRIVVLQEAFTDAAKRIGAIGGYRHIVSGPGLDEIAAADADPAHQAFLKEGSVLTGEGMGKQTDSGLMILSDFPVLAVRRMPFAAHACAGFDCLANKGMVMALVRVPGVARPVAIVTTHLNARKASGVAIPRAFRAYRWQAEALDGFVAAARAMDVPVILAGDLNVGGSKPRRAVMEGYAARWTGGTNGARGALAACLAQTHPCGAPSDDARRAFEHNKDWQVAIPGGGVALRPVGIDVPFGREPGGAMLSDHAGYVVRYRVIEDAAPTKPLHVAGDRSG